MVSLALPRLLLLSIKVSRNFTVSDGMLTLMAVYGMGLDLALILGIMGTVWTGNPLSLDPGFSIGGPASPNLLGNALGLLGE